MSIRTILFDLDGTLIDSNQLIVASFKHTFDNYKLKFTDEEIIEFNGPPLIDTFKQIDPFRAEEMFVTYRDHNILMHNQYVTAFPKVVETLNLLKKMEVKLGIVSTKAAPGVKRGLDLIGVNNLFDSIVSLDDVVHAKPHAEPVLKAMEALEGERDSTLMVGDNSHDIEAGKNAGVKTAGVAWSQKGKERLLSYKPNFMLESMTDLIQLVEV